MFGTRLIFKPLQATAVDSRLPFSLGPLLRRSQSYHEQMKGHISPGRSLIGHELVGFQQHMLSCGAKTQAQTRTIYTIADGNLGLIHSHEIPKIFKRLPVLVIRPVMKGHAEKVSPCADDRLRSLPVTREREPNWGANVPRLEKTLRSLVK